jgi:nucleoside-diphosphate-sugar epimerase
MLSEPVRQSLAREISHVFHLAAVYDLAVPETIAWKVNVNGTRHVTDWVRTLPHLKRYVYYSTAYVSGTREGRIYEHELEMNQSFKNHYERTKFEAEVLVQKWKGELPLTVIRPGIVKGNSHTGETIKFDGLYFMLRFFDRLRFLPIIPYPSNRGAIGNFVPVDYVTKATVYLAHSDKGVGKTYHLTDPHAYTMNEVYAMLMEEYLGRKPKGTVPLSWMKAALSVPAVRKWLKVEKEALDYFDLVAVYDTTEAERDLADSSIRLPDFRETVKPLVEFYRLHREDPDKMIPVT